MTDDLEAKVKALEAKLAEVLAKLDPKPAPALEREPFVPFDRTAGASRLPRTRAEMPEWMRRMVDATPEGLMADIRSDRAAKAQPGSLAAYPATDGPAPVVGTRHRK